MKKIITLFKRDYEGNRQVFNEVVPSAEWVQAGEGVPTKKIDGTCCMIENGVLWKRYEIKKGGKPPWGFKPANEVDTTTGKQQGWVEVGNGNEDKWHREAFERLQDKKDGTYELVGPKVQGNPEKFEVHTLVSHSDIVTFQDVPTDFDGLREWLRDKDIEGIVWHHPDGRMVKIKKRDFGMKRL